MRRRPPKGTRPPAPSRPALVTALLTSPDGRRDSPGFGGRRRPSLALPTAASELVHGAQFLESARLEIMYDCSEVRAHQETATPLADTLRNSPTLQIVHVHPIAHATASASATVAAAPGKKPDVDDTAMVVEAASNVGVADPRWVTSESFLRGAGQVGMAESWACPRCSFQNPPNSAMCSACCFTR